MRRIPLVLALTLLLAAPAAHATLMISAEITQGGGAPLFFTCTDNQASSPTCPGGDTNPAIGTIQLVNQTLGGVIINTQFKIR
jgi:hypothetical protein